MGEVVSMKEWGLKPKFENIPAALKTGRRWVCWVAKDKGGPKPAKVPVMTNGRAASVRDDRTWNSYERVRQAYLDNPGKFSGIGFVLTRAKVDVTVLDLDNCYNPIDGPDEWAMDIIEAADSYTEVSPSDRGIRIIVFGDAGAFTNNERGVEVYTSKDSTRYLTITGHVLEGYETVKPMHGNALTIALDEYRPAPEPERAPPTETPVGEDEDEIKRILSAYVNTASDAAKYERWLEIGMALHHQYSGDQDGMELWDELSQTMSGYNRAELESKWASFGRSDKALTMRTLFMRARDKGVDIGQRTRSEAATFAELANMVDEEVHTKEYDRPWRTLQELRTTPPPAQLIEDLLAMGQVSQISGEPGAGKTFVAMELAYGVATGRDVFGLRTVPGAVLYLAYEGVYALEQRVRAWKARDRPLPDNMYVVGGRDAAPLTDVHAWKDWVTPVIQELEPSLVIIDTFAAATPGMSTNDEERVGAVVRTIRNLAETAGIHVMTIHHPPKGGALTGQKSRGSGIIEGDLDSQLWVTKTEGTAREWEVSKQRALGSYGLAKRFALKPITTEMVTQWGQERAVYLDMDVVETDSYAPELLALSEMVRGALQAHGNTSIDMGHYNTIMERWLAEHHKDSSDDVIKRAKARAKRHLHGEFEVEENGQHRVVSVAVRANS